MTTAAQPSGPAPAKPLPIIEAERRADGEKRDIALWPEPRKNVSQEQYEAMSEQEQRKLNSMRDLHGYVTVRRNGGQDVRVGISGWLSMDPNAPTRIKIMGDLNSGHGMMGSIRAMTRKHGAQANGAHGLVLIGDLELNMPAGKEKVTVTGQINEKYPDRELMVDAARVCGFPDAMIEQFTSRIDLDKAQKAKTLVENERGAQARPAMA